MHVQDTYIIELEPGKFVRLYVCNPGGYFIEGIHWITGEVTEITRIEQAHAHELITKEQQPNHSSHPICLASPDSKLK